eukprot:1157842-Pelagomonas_calceolata.AAC.3
MWRCRGRWGHGGLWESVLQGCVPAAAAYGADEVTARTAVRAAHTTMDCTAVNTTAAGAAAAGSQPIVFVAAALSAQAHISCTW